MARFSERFVSQVQQATDIVDVVGQYVALKKRGKEFVGLCPFHEDHRPSMYVSPAKQIFKCFACGAGGSVFQFLMGIQKVTFPESVRQLAERAGIPIPEDTTPQRTDSDLSAETLVKLTTFAARFFRDRLGSDEGAAVLEYARSRKLTDESIKRFGLGYAPDSWEALRSAAIGAGFTDRQLTSAGLVVQREDGSTYDRFRNRMIFPIFDVTGRVIAFGGRAMADDERAKYLNSPETVLFDKSANLYGLNWSHRHIAQTGQAVIVEGYLDALMLIQEGIENVAATLGTSLTERHVRLLGRYAREVVLVFDSDTAGQAAAERAIEIFLAQRLHVRVATVPAHTSGPSGQETEIAGQVVKDPCDYVLAAGPEAVRKLLDEAPDALGFAWSRRADAYRRADTLPEKREILEEFLRLVVSSSAYGSIDALREGLLIGQVSELVGLSTADVTEHMRRLSRRIRRSVGGPPDRDDATGTNNGGAAVRAEKWLLGALINEPELFESVRESITPEMFAEPLLRSIAEHLWRLACESRLEITALLMAGQTEQWGRVVTDLQSAGQQRGNYTRTLADAAEVLLRRRRLEQMQQLKDGKDTNQNDVLRKISEEARKPDPRRRPKV
ncbi:MAG: DNA primase [Planctomycetota bacterium]|nr:DNA primase [Planctomycetota bacterium]